MKPKRLNRKLFLNKETIALLQAKEMKPAKGGDGVRCAYTDLSACIPTYQATCLEMCTFYTYVCCPTHPNDCRP